MSSLCQLNFSNPPVPDQIDRFVSLPLISLPLCHFGHGKCVQCLARTIQRTCNTSLNHTRSGLKGNIPQPASVLYLWLSLSSVSSLGLSLSSIFPVPWLQLRGLRRRLRARYAWKLWATLPPFPVDTHTASCVSRSTGTSPQPRAPVSVLSADSASPRGPSWPEATCWWRRWRSWGWARLSTLSPCVRKRPPRLACIPIFPRDHRSSVRFISSCWSCTAATTNSASVTSVAFWDTKAIRWCVRMNNNTRFRCATAL